MISERFHASTMVPKYYTYIHRIIPQRRSELKLLETHMQPKSEPSFGVEIISVVFVVLIWVKITVFMSTISCYEVGVKIRWLRPNILYNWIMNFEKVHFEFLSKLSLPFFFLIYTYGPTFYQLKGVISFQ